MRQERVKTLEKHNAKYGYIMISPILIGILLFSVFPIFFSLYISFHEWNMMSDPAWIGLGNYKAIFDDPMLGITIKNTLTYVAITIPGSILAGLFIALLLNSSIKGVPVYRVLFFLPNITTTVAVAIVWTWLYNRDYGLFNSILRLLGLPIVRWLSSQKWAMLSVSIMSIWQMMGYIMIIIAAGLKGIDITYYEAARIDGASSWKMFTRITLPMLTPTLFFLIVTLSISGIQMFDAAHIMTEGGPGYATRSIVMQIYNTAFEYFRMGMASSYSWVLFIIVFIFTIVQFKFQDKWVNYDV